MNSEKGTKYIFVTGGVISGLGKGIACASIGYILKARGLRVNIQKFDPYINVDPGTMSPYQHGEVYVLDDGAETDLDLGHYERFIDIDMKKENNTTTGQVYYEVIKRERKGDYLGATVQVIPHITDEIKRRIRNISQSRKYDVVITEVGGTVGDIESLPFLEAIRQFCLEVGHGNFLNIHLTLVPYIETSGEIKTKPTQHSVMKLREIGIQPDILLCRSKYPLTDEVKSKIALFCNVSKGAVINALDVDTIYEIPLMFDRQGLGDLILERLHLSAKESQFEDLTLFVKKIRNPSDEVTICICGKYTQLRDAYKSIIESFTHAGVANDCRVNLKWVEAEDVEGFSDPEGILGDVDGLLVPGGFGERGIEGKIKAIKFVRERGIPFFGICLGLQCAVIEFARNVCGLKEANSTEFDEDTPNPVIDLMEEQKRIVEKGGTMRLGAYTAVLSKGTKTFELYGKRNISERHRHRYEVNNKYLDILTQNGLVVAGVNKELNLVEVIELRDHPWFIACQFHPEFKSRIGKPHPLFRGFVRAALEYKRAKGE
ncbi:MAG: CTP synthase [Candidatus Neomarinimicrobiota bacterium]|nr:MAG: CTP synthase [Candidatus Neomarinimicrobiota bacterium]